MVKETSLIKTRANAILNKRFSPLWVWEKKNKTKPNKKGRETKSIFYQFKGSSLFEIFEKWSKNNSLYVTYSSARDKDGYHTTFLEQADLS